MERLLQQPTKIAACLHAGVFFSAPSWQLKLANMLTVGTRQVQLIADTLIDRLHIDAEIPREHAKDVQHCVRTMFMAAVRGDTNSKGIQCNQIPKSLTFCSGGNQWPLDCPLCMPVRAAHWPFHIRLAMWSVPSRFGRGCDQTNSTACRRVLTKHMYPSASMVWSRNHRHLMTLCTL